MCLQVRRGQRSSRDGAFEPGTADLSVRSTHLPFICLSLPGGVFFEHRKCRYVVRVVRKLELRMKCGLINLMSQLN